MAYKLFDLLDCLAIVGGRDALLKLRQGSGDKFTHGRSPDARYAPPAGMAACAIYIPDPLEFHQAQDMELSIRHSVFEASALRLGTSAGLDEMVAFMTTDHAAAAAAKAAHQTQAAPASHPVAAFVDQAWAFMAENPSAVVAAFGIIVTVLLFWLGARRNRMQATFNALELIQAKDAREARFSLRDILSPKAEHGGDFSKMKSTERATVPSIVLLFGFIGALGRRGRVDLNVFFDAFASSVVINHERMRAYSDWRDSYRPYADGTLWKDFDWLSENAKLYLAIRGDPNPFRRMASRIGFAKPAWAGITALEASAHTPLPPSPPPPAPSPASPRAPAAKSGAPVVQPDPGEA